MALVSVIEAAKLTGLSEKTLYKHMKLGRITATSTENGKKSLETSELLRVYGAFKELPVSERISIPSPETSREKEIENLKAVNSAYKMILDEKDKRLDEKDQRIELLTYVRNEKKPLTWVWVIVAVIISVLTTNLAWLIGFPALFKPLASIGL